MTLTTYNARINRYCVDAYAWIEYFEGTQKGRTVLEIVEDSSNDVFVSPVIIAEVINAVKKRNGDVEAAFSKMTSLARVSELTAELAKETGLIYNDLRKTIRDFPLADAFLLAAAKQLSARIVTGDPHFAKVKNVVFLS